MRTRAAGLALAVLSTACASGPAALATYDMGGGCYLWSQTTTMTAHDGRTFFGDGPMTGTEIAWPVGFTAQSSAVGGLEIHDRSGTVVARTGVEVTLPGGSGPDGKFWACSPVR